MKKKIKDLTLEEIINHCSPSVVCFHECILSNLCYHSFRLCPRAVRNNVDLEKEVELDE